MNIQNIKVYLTGGAVRDRIIGRPVKDLDFVVVGASQETMIKLGFTQVGADFPVFLHPITSDEYALARTERKTAAGYHGFEVNFNTEVTLYDDLARRDLRMNAMAIEVDTDILISGEMKLIGDIIDPYRGQDDIAQGVINVTSEAFEEDPLRVLRTARFAARYNFEISAEALDIMCIIVLNGEMEALPMERVFAEFKKAMMEDHYGVFFDILYEVNIYDSYFKELVSWKNFGLDFANEIGATFEERVCLLLISLKPSEAETILTRIKAPKHLIDMAMWTCRIENILDDMSFGIIEPFTNKTLWERLEVVKAWNNLDKMQSVARLFLFYDGIGFKDIQKVFTATRAGSKIGFNDLDENTRDKLVGKEIGVAISQKRLVVIEELNLFPS